MARAYLPDPDQLARGWAVVLQYSDRIDRLCRRMCRDRDVRFEDLRQDACIRIARTYAFSCPPHVAVGWWVQYMVRRSHAQLALEASRIRRRFAPMPVLRGDDGVERENESAVTDDRAGATQTETRVGISLALRRATLPQLLAVEALMEGDDALGLGEDAGTLARRAMRGRRYTRAEVTT